MREEGGGEEREKLGQKLGIYRRDFFFNEYKNINNKSFFCFIRINAIALTFHRVNEYKNRGILKYLIWTIVVLG